jgi:catechol 2,3-dioxygenase-like lactoylglutathione lyase family enzyme
MLLQKTHIDLDVDDAEQSAAFYEALFGAPPARRSTALAVFEFDSPPLVLTLRKPARRFGRHGLFALVVTEPEHVGCAAIALRRVGVRLRLEDQGIEASDPDGNAWRVRFVASAVGRSVVAIREGTDT